MSKAEKAAVWLCLLAGWLAGACVGLAESGLVVAAALCGLGCGGCFAGLVWLARGGL